MFDCIQLSLSPTENFQFPPSNPFHSKEKIAHSPPERLLQFVSLVSIKNTSNEIHYLWFIYTWSRGKQWCWIIGTTSEVLLSARRNQRFVVNSPRYICLLSGFFYSSMICLRSNLTTWIDVFWRGTKTNLFRFHSEGRDGVKGRENWDVIITSYIDINWILAAERVERQIQFITLSLLPWVMWRW